MNELILGDCLEKMKDIPSGSVDLICADPPYGTTACSWDTIIPLEPMWVQLNRIIKPNGAIILNSAQPFTTVLISSNMDMFKYCWVWEKDKGTGFSLSKKQPLRKTEDIVVFYRKQPFYDYKGEKLSKPYKHTLPISKSDSSPGANKGNLKDIGKPELGLLPIIQGSRKYVKYTHRNKINIIYFSRDNANKGVHPTQKPVALIEFLIKTYTSEGETVLDFCMGSGSTGVAAENLNRNFIGIEAEKKWFDIASERIKKTRKQFVKFNRIFEE